MNKSQDITDYVTPYTPERLNTSAYRVRGKPDLGGCMYWYIEPHGERSGCEYGYVSMSRTPIGITPDMGGVLLINAARADGARTPCPCPWINCPRLDDAAEAAALTAAVEWVAGGALVDVNALEEAALEAESRWREQIWDDDDDGWDDGGWNDEPCDY